MSTSQVNSGKKKNEIMSTTQSSGGKRKRAFDSVSQPTLHISNVPSSSGAKKKEEEDRFFTIVSLILARLGHLK